MPVYAIIQNGTVINVVEYPADPGSPPPAFPVGTTAVLNAGASIGWGYANGVFTNPNPPLPPPPPTPAQLAATALSQAQQVALQCLTYGVAYPTTWQTYATSVAAVAAGTSTVMPPQPAMPPLPASTPVKVV